MKQSLLKFRHRNAAVLLLFLFSFPLISSAQLTQEWAKQFSYAGGAASAADMVVDATGNIYITGTTSLSGVLKTVTIKYNASGVQQWAQYYTGGKGAYAAGIAIDQNGNVYITGTEYGHNDYYGVDYEDFLTIKYNDAGVQQWVQKYEHLSDFLQRIAGNGQYVAADDQGNVFVAGLSAQYTMKAVTVVKYNAAGVQQWEVHEQETDKEAQLLGLFTDQQGNVYVGSNSPWQRGENTVISKYDTKGKQLWQSGFYNTSGNSHGEHAFGITMDSAANIYATGVFFLSDVYSNYKTVKITRNGGRAWQKESDQLGSNTDHNPVDIAVDRKGNTFVTGIVATTNHGDDIGTVKYAPDGNILWTAIYNGSGNGKDTPVAINLDSSGNAYITGYSTITGGVLGKIMLKYDTAGTLKWEDNFTKGEAFPVSKLITIDKNNNIIVTGIIGGSTGLAEILTAKFSQQTSSNGVCCFNTDFGQSLVCGPRVNANNCLTSGADAFYIGQVSNCHMLDSVNVCNRTPAQLTLRGSYLDQSASVELLWQARTSAQTKGFYIQRSTDGLHYKTIGFMPSGNDYNTEQHYTFRDVYPMLQAYYQILYFDGKGYVSETLQINALKSGEYRIVPNPAASQVQVLLPSEAAMQPVDIKVYDLGGKLILQKKTTAGAQVQLDVSNLKQGTYLIRIGQQNKTYLQKFIKN